MQESYRKAKKAFSATQGKHRLFVFYDMETFPPSREEINRCMDLCQHNGVACVIPRIPLHVAPSSDLIDQLAAMYLMFAQASRRTKVHVCFHLRPVVEQSYYMSPYHQASDNDNLTQVLVRREYYCDPEETLHLALQPDTLMALVAYDSEHSDTIDLRPYIKDGYLDYTVPRGNWNIEEYVCTKKLPEDASARYTCNRLSFDSCTNFLDRLFAALGKDLTSELGKTITSLYAPELCFHAPNRRNWDPSFNRVFIDRFGIDPAPYYPTLYHNIGEKDAHIKAMFMDCRAELFRSGILCAIKAFCDRHDVRTFYSLAEPKLASCSWLNGDTLAGGLFSPCAVQEKSYLYGMNSTHLAASAADNFGSKYVCCELYRDYTALNETITYKDVLNAFGHGTNLAMAHIDNHILDLVQYPQRFSVSSRYTFPTFVTRAQSLLRGGSRINDIAMLYPIYALHDKVHLYEEKTDGQFEYPDTPTSCNYMTVLDTLSTYAGQDVTILHPTVVNSNCYTQNGVLHLKNPFRDQKFRVLILPGADMVSLENLRLVKDFYDGGGKVIAVGTLPDLAFEYDASCEAEGKDEMDFMGMSEYGTRYDREVRAIVRHIFGKKATSRDIVRDFFYNSNANGGEAYYLGSTFTALDGTEATDFAALNDALQSFHMPLDVYMPDMPRFECMGALNNPFPEFTRLGLAKHIPGGGMISHIHKKRDDLDIYFFANTTHKTYNETIYLRGIRFPERWDPHSGSSRKIPRHYVRYRGEIYTAVELYLPCDRGVFLISPHRPAADKILANAASLPDMSRHINMMGHSNISWYMR